MASVSGSTQATIRAMVTDDTSLYRRTLSDILDSIPDVEVIAAAYDGEDCLAQASKLLPDFITMDIQMPRRDGLSTLEEIKRRKLPIHVVMVCSETQESAEQTVQALRMGALDMILKPNTGDFEANKRSLEAQLANQVQTVRALKGKRHPFSGPAESTGQESNTEPTGATASTATNVASEATPSRPRRQTTNVDPVEASPKSSEKIESKSPASDEPLKRRKYQAPLPENGSEDSVPAKASSLPVQAAKQRLAETEKRFLAVDAPGAKANETLLPKPRKANSPKCICIGVSTGGPQSLGTIVQNFPVGLPLPIFIVQHMPPLFTKSLADHLNRAGKVKVTEAVDGEMAVDGQIYIAPGGKHMRVEKKPSGLQIQVTDDPPVGACKPSVDYLFESVDRCVGGEAIAIILTGMGSDGLAGCKRLHASGARVIAQNAETCVVYGMPRQIVDNNLAHEILPLDEIAGRISQLIPRKLNVCN